MPIYQKPNTSRPAKGHKTYPYLLRGLRVERPNQVWCSDITYLPMRRGFLYLVAIMDWHNRKVLSWRISNTLEAQFCVDALNEAIHNFGPPEIMNTDQGSQFTSFAWTDRLRRSGVRISMDGKGRFLDNIFIERLWRTLKYECVYLHAWETGSETKEAIRKWMTFYNHQRPHSALGGQPPALVYWQSAGPSTVSLPGSPLEPFRQKIVLHRQPPDLGVKLLDFGFGRAALLAAREYVRHALDGLPLPRADLVRVQLMLRRDLLHGLVATQRFQRHLGLKLICKVPALCHVRIPSKVRETP